MFMILSVFLLSLDGIPFIGKSNKRVYWIEEFSSQICNFCHQESDIFRALIFSRVTGAEHTFSSPPSKAVLSGLSQIRLLKGFVNCTLYTNVSDYYAPGGKEVSEL